MSSTYILGISAYYHDSAAALIQDGQIVAAAQEERFSRQKGDSSFPHHAINYCLDQAKINEQQLDYIVFYENPLVKFERLTSIYHLTAPLSLASYLKAFPTWLTRNLWLKSEISREMGLTKKQRICLCDHHLSHAASAFFPSPYERAAILTIDGVGEWSTTTYGIGNGNTIKFHKEIRFPNSLGLLYSAFTYFTGFKINSGEYKLMGLAPYGSPIYAEVISTRLIDIKEDGSIALNQKYFNYLGGLTMTNKNFEKLFDGPPRKPESLITQREMDIAASIQSVLNEIILQMARYVHRETQMQNLVLAGGVALNVVSCGIISQTGPFDSIWIQPAAGDAGGALGAALWMWYQKLNNDRQPQPEDSIQGSLLGPAIAEQNQNDDSKLSQMGGVWENYCQKDLQQKIAALIAEGKVVSNRPRKNGMGTKSAWLAFDFG